MDIGEFEHEFQKCGVVLGLAAHRHDNGVDIVFFEIGVVDHRCLEALGRIAEMYNELCASADRHWRVPLLIGMALKKWEQDFDASSRDELILPEAYRANAQGGAAPAYTPGFQARRSRRRREVRHRSGGEIPRACGRSRCGLRGPSLRRYSARRGSRPRYG